MLHDDVGQATLRWNLLEELLERYQAPRRCADAYDASLERPLRVGIGRRRSHTKVCSQPEATSNAA